MGTAMFIMSVDTACDVYDAFIMAEALSEEERIKVLEKFVEDGRVTCMDSDLSKEETLKALQSHLSVIYIKHERKQ